MKAVVPTWSDSDILESDGGNEDVEAQASFCLMAKEGDVSEPEVYSDSN